MLLIIKVSKLQFMQFLYTKSMNKFNTNFSCTFTYIGGLIRMILGCCSKPPETEKNRTRSTNR